MGGGAIRDLINHLTAVGLNVIVWDEQGPQLTESNMPKQSLEEHFAEVTQGVRSVLANANVPSLDFALRASGRTLDGTLQVEVSLGSQYDSPVRGRSVDAVLKELIRRKGWQAQNDPLELDYTPTPKDPS